MFHNIRILAERHHVRVISFVENDEERDLLGALEEFCESVTAVRRIPDFSPRWLSLEPFMMRAFADRKSTRLNSSHIQKSRMPSSA